MREQKPLLFIFMTLFHVRFLVLSLCSFIPFLNDEFHQFIVFNLIVVYHTQLACEKENRNAWNCEEVMHDSDTHSGAWKLTVSTLSRMCTAVYSTHIWSVPRWLWECVIRTSVNIHMCLCPGCPDECLCDVSLCHCVSMLVVVYLNRIVSA